MEREKRSRGTYKVIPRLRSRESIRHRAEMITGMLGSGTPRIASISIGSAQNGQLNQTNKLNQTKQNKKTQTFSLLNSDQFPHALLQQFSLPFPLTFLVVPLKRRMQPKGGQVLLVLQPDGVVRARQDGSVEPELGEHLPDPNRYLAR